MHFLFFVEANEKRHNSKYWKHFTFQLNQPSWSCWLFHKACHGQTLPTVWVQTNKKTIFIDLLFILNLLVILWRRYKDINLNGPTKFLEVIPVFLLLLRCLPITSWSSQFVQVFQEVYCYLYRLKEEIRKTLQTWSISPKERALNEHSEGSRMAIWFSEDASHVVRFCVKKKKKKNWSYWLVWNWL